MAALLTETQKNHLKTQGWWNALSPQEQDLLFSQCQIHTYSPRTNITEQDTPVTHLHLILEGELRTSRGHESGRDMVVDLIHPGTLVGLTALFNDGHHAVTLYAVSKTVALAIPSPCVQTLITKHAPFAAELLSLIAQNHAQHLHQLSQVTLHTAEERLGTYILDYMLSQKDEPHTTTLPANKAIIAQQLGMTPETLSRTLSLLRKKGIEINKNEVSLTHPRALCPYCDTALVRRCRHGNSAECPIRQQKNPLK